MNAELRKLYDKKGQIVKQMEDVGKPVKDGKQEKLTEEQRTQFRKWNEDLKEISKQIEDLNILAEAEAQRGVEEGNDITKREQQGKVETRFADFKGMNSGEIAEERSRVWTKSQTQGIATFSEDERAIYNVIERDNKIYNKWMKRGVKGLTPDEMRILESRALTTTTGSSGEYTIPEGFSGYIIERLKFISEVNQHADTVSTASGNPIPYPTGDDTSNVGELLSENTEAAEQDISFGVKNLGAYTFSTKYMRVPNQLIQDNGVNLEAYIAKQFANRVARIENQYLTTGTGSSQPEGYVAGATQGKVTASTSVFTTAELLGLEHSVDKAYRNSGCVWAMHDNLLLEIKELSLTDDPVRPLWIPSLSANAPDKLLGYRYFINNDMASASTTGAKIICFGDFKNFLIRRVNGLSLQRLTELHALYNQTTFVGFSRMDSKVLQTQAIKYLEMS
jgi:HK97 family phage major capsid protein